MSSRKAHSRVNYVLIQIIIITEELNLLEMANCSDKRLRRMRTGSQQVYQVLYVCMCVCMCIVLWPVQYDLFVCDSADHKVDSGPSLFLPRKLFPFGFNLLQIEYYRGNCIILQATILKMFWVKLGFLLVFKGHYSAARFKEIPYVCIHSLSPH